MKTLTITEEQMTFVLKEFLKQYSGAFDHASFDDTGNGYVVHFHQSPDIPPMQATEEAEQEQLAKRPDDDYPSYTLPISIPMPDFGGFGGGSSGGAGASGGW